MWLPPRISHQLADRTRSFNADVLRSCALDDGDPVLVEYTRRLQEYSPRLLMVRAHEHVVPGVPMKPGYYHVLVRLDDAPYTIAVVEGEDGEFVVPTSRVFERLAAGDMTQRRNLDRFAHVQRDEHDANEREKRTDREERREHVRDLVNAYTRTSVSMNPDTPWTQNAQPNSLRARDEAKKRRP
jgi:hypothetical protein